MNDINKQSDQKRNNISNDLYDIYNKLGKYELWLAKQEYRELTLKSVIEDRKIIGRMMKQYTSH